MKKQDPKIEEESIGNFFNIYLFYLFFWLHWVLVAACRVFVEVSFVAAQALRCGAQVSL